MNKNMNIFKKFSKNSVYRKFFVYSFFVIIIPFIFVLFSVVEFYCYRNESIEKTEFINDCIRSTAEMETAMDIADNVYVQYFDNTDIKMLLSTEPNSVEYMKSNLVVYDLFNKTINVSSYIESIYLYDIDKEYVYSSQNSNSISDFNDKNWYDYYLKEKHRNFTVYSTKGNVISIMYQLVDLDELMGFLIINIKTNNPESSVILDGDGKPLYGYSGLCDLSELDENMLQDIKSVNYFHNGKNSFVLTDMDNMHFLFFQKKQNGNGMPLFFIVVISTLMSLCISLLFAFKHTNYYYKSIADIILQIKNTSSLPVHLQNSENEIEFIKETIYDIMMQNSNMQSELIEKVIEVNSMQALALQAQINPHFLFNTLNLINGLIIEQTGDDCEATTLILLLSEVFEFIIEDNNVIPLWKEVEYAQKYVEIEMIKKNRSFDIEWNIDKEVEKSNVIKMILQPIIENSITHGIRNLTDRRGHIIINAHREGKDIVISVYDNGYAISKEGLEKINRLLEGEKIEKEKHIGLVNVNKRIQLVCGKDYGCKLYSDSTGTMCIINLPLNFE